MNGLRIIGIAGGAYLGFLIGIFIVVAIAHITHQDSGSVAPLWAWATLGACTVGGAVGGFLGTKF